MSRIKTSYLDRLRARAGIRLFEALYGSFAPFYDWVSRFFFAGQWSAWQRRSFEYIEGQRVLELGFGTGELLLEMCRRGYTPRGVDASPYMLRIARRKLGLAGCAGRLWLGGASRLPLPDGALDAVVSTFPSGYILEPETWTEMRRVLKPGGRLIVVLGGELLPYDHRSKLLIRFHGLVYGGRTPAEGVAGNLSFPGFDIRFANRSDDRGVAYLLIAEKIG